MIDCHCHLNFKAFEDDFDEVIKSALEAGVTRIINVGTKLDSSRKAIEIAEKYNSPAGELYATVGIHPHHADKYYSCHPEFSSGSRSRNKFGMTQKEVRDDIFWKEFEKLAKNNKVVAIGETGLDFYSYESNGITDQNLQKKLFIKQIEIAHKLKLPLQIHNRQAGKEIIEIILAHKAYLANPPGMFHCFSGDLDLLKSALQMGFYVGFDGNITYKGIARGETTDLKDLVKYAPIDRIITETDSPYLTPVPHRGQRNEPKYAIIVAQAIGEIKSLTFEEVDRITTENANKIFNLDARR